MSSVEHSDSNAISRALADGEYDGRPVRVATVDRTYPTTPDDLWDAVTNPDRIRRWFNPVSGDLRLGGRYQLEDNASGEITACDAPRSFAATWEFGGAISWIEVSIEASGDGSIFTLRHLAEVPSEPDDFWETYGPGAVGVGWDLGLYGLSLHVADPAVQKAIEDEEAWATSPAGLSFISASSSAWAEASIDYGTDRDAALAAAGRTTKFFTGA